MPTLLIVDDEPNVLYSLEKAFRSDSLDVITAGKAGQAIEVVDQCHPDAVILDVRLPDMSGLDAFEQIRRIDPRLPVIIVTNRGHKTGAIRKTPLMRVADGENYILVASQGGAPQHPAWYYNLKADPNVEIRDKTEVYPMCVREVEDEAERARLWKLAVEAFPPYQTYQENTERLIPVFVAEPIA